MSLKKIIMVSIVLGAVGFVSACGTVHGFGRDVSNAGHGIQRAAR